jgi:uncharacterized membrane protein YphA (DoxX/SURF4 family)
MTWFWYWVLITGLPAAFIALADKEFGKGFVSRLFIFIACFLMLGLFTAWGLWMLSLFLELGQGAVNWWNSQPEATGSSSNGNQVPPYFFLIPMFMMLGFLIRGNGK